ncbi:MAG TPA: hypothetical protein VJU80_17495, partial [Solirubrobacteraceae bacterium]|nr:hypothetical protein [Solirubrobacteraceae bacterium]
TIKKRGDAMSAQLEAPRQPVAAPRPHMSVAPPPVPTATTESVDGARDPDRGIGLLLSFTGALLVMVVDVVLIGAVARSWVLIPGFALLLVMAAIVFRSIMRLLADGAEVTPRDAR